jgi:hypothetical protein
MFVAQVDILPPMLITRVFVRRAIRFKDGRAAITEGFVQPRLG